MMNTIIQDKRPPLDMDTNVIEMEHQLNLDDDIAPYEPDELPNE